MGFAFLLIKVNFLYSHEKNLNIKNIFHIFALFPSATSKRELDYFHQKVNMWVTSRVAEPLKTYDLRKLGHFKEIPNKLATDGKIDGHPKDKFWQLCYKIAKNQL